MNNMIVSDKQQAILNALINKKNSIREISKYTGKDYSHTSNVISKLSKICIVDLQVNDGRSYIYTLTDKGIELCNLLNKVFKLMDGY
jgi:DNA-binding MarR family transcriptional regulator